MFDEKSYSQKMDKAIEVFSKELSSPNIGSPNFLAIFVLGPVYLAISFFFLRATEN